MAALVPDDKLGHLREKNVTNDQTELAFFWDLALEVPHSNYVLLKPNGRTKGSISLLVAALVPDITYWFLIAQKLMPATMPRLSSGISAAINGAT